MSAINATDIDRVLHKARANLHSFFMAGMAAGDCDEADELVQLTFIKAWENWDKFKPATPDDTDRGGWLRTLARNVGNDYLDSKRARRAHEVPMSAISGSK